MTTITVVCNEFRRPHLLLRQMDAIASQTVEPTEVLIWHNDPGTNVVPRLTLNVFAPGKVSKSARASVNFGVWARFAFALNAESEYVAVFDDDTIPGPRWFESCLRTMDAGEALLGTVGVIHDRGLWTWRKVGWRSHNQEPVRVDYVGHAWFFKRAWLSAFWRELPPPGQILCGEDMHFSFMLQRYLGIPTIVPPHPADDRSVWGSTEGELGADGHSIWESNPVDGTGTPAQDAMRRVFERQRESGWRLVNE